MKVNVPEQGAAKHDAVFYVNHEPWQLVDGYH
jgi:hypothetical protein